MSVPCVAAPREHGEETRNRLAEAGALDREYEIEVADGTIYIPVERDAVPKSLADRLTERDLTRRDRQTTPADLLGYDPSLERLGDIVIVDEDDPERAREIADAVTASDLPCETVVNRASKIKGELRVRDWELLAGESTRTVHREYGHEFLLDIAEVYFSPRLATERHRVVQQVTTGEHAFDMFTGVGPYAIPMASRGAEVVACDLNEAAVEYCRENAARNGVADHVTVLQGDVREVADDWEGWADRIVMNLPHSADEFIDTAVRLAGEECVLHYYDIEHDEDPFGPGTRAVREAAGDGYEVTVETERVVRSYAPHELNVCLDVRLERAE